MERLVSVIIPTYNRASLITRSVMSVLNQTYENIELIVVDDGSTDDTKSVLAQIDDSRLKYVCMSKNSGACAARNYGISIANGEYIAFQDSDDFWHINKLEVQLQNMIENNADISFCKMNSYMVGSNIPKLVPQECESGFMDYKKLLMEPIISTQCLILKKDCFKETLFDEKMPRLQDWDFILRVAKKYPVFHVDIPLVDMYIQQDSISSNPKKGIRAINELMLKNEDVLIENPEIMREWYLMLAGYKLANSEEPKTEYRRALEIRRDMKTELKYLLSCVNLMVPYYKAKYKD